MLIFCCRFSAGRTMDETLPRRPRCAKHPPFSWKQQSARRQNCPIQYSLPGLRTQHRSCRLRRVHPPNHAAVATSSFIHAAAAATVAAVLCSCCGFVRQDQLPFDKVRVERCARRRFHNNAQRGRIPVHAPLLFLSKWAIVGVKGKRRRCPTREAVRIS